MPLLPLLTLLPFGLSSGLFSELPSIHTKPPWRRGIRISAARLMAVLALWGVFLGAPFAAQAAPGLCVGPVCGDEFSRSAQYHWQLRLRVNDQQGHRERLVVDCRTGALSPRLGLVERGYAGAVARRVCRLAGEGDG